MFPKRGPLFEYTDTEIFFNRSFAFGQQDIILSAMCVYPTNSSFTKLPPMVPKIKTTKISNEFEGQIKTSVSNTYLETDK